VSVLGLGMLAQVMAAMAWGMVLAQLKAAIAWEMVLA